MLNTLGDDCVNFVIGAGQGNEYRINLSECLALRDQYEQGDRADDRHRESKRVAYVAGAVGGVIGTVLGSFLLWLFQRLALALGG
jgi:hypothetical protein